MRLNELVKELAPTIEEALKTQYADIAMKFLAVRLVPGCDINDEYLERMLAKHLSSPKELIKLKAIEKEFVEETEGLGLDFKLLAERYNRTSQTTKKWTPQVIITALFLTFYFAIVFSMLYIEISDSLNMAKGENSLLGELQLLLGVLTAGLGQIMAYWFGFAKTPPKAS